MRDPDVPIDPTALVPPGLHYHVSNGYRSVAGDSCVGGVQHEMLLHPCLGSMWTHHVSHGGWTEGPSLCFKRVHMSADAGETWRVLEDYVVQYG